MGGATLGHALAQGGMKVLFCEKGRSHIGNPSAHRGSPAEFLIAGGPNSSKSDSLQRAGRHSDEMWDVSASKQNSFIPFLGCGTGGSTSLYAMALERFFPADFEPRPFYPHAADSTLPQRWPISFAGLLPYYEKAEALYRVRGAPDPLRGADAPQHLLPSPQLTPASREISELLTRNGLHPYSLPVACEKIEGCEGCDGFLCPRACKNDSARISLDPALTRHGAALLDECEVIGLHAANAQITSVVCRRKGETLRLRGKMIVLAAGALATPSLLLASTSQDWPRGLANNSGLVGRNLMRHLVDLYLVPVVDRHSAGNNLKELAVNDFYLDAGEKLGTLQSFNHMPPGYVIVQHFARSWKNPLLGKLLSANRRWIASAIDRYFKDKVPLASILEDLPYESNQVLPPAPRSSDAGWTVRFQYKISSHDRRRLRAFRSRIANALHPTRFQLLKQAEDNTALAHVCGTCRFGADPAASVLDPNNKAHDLANLYVVDSSFFPSSSGINPSLTIAANALRVAEHLLRS